jgi:selenocysteine lyase/cysteine desulfurase
MPSHARALFDIPDDVAYINCAYLSPFLKDVVATGRQAVERKAHPWTITHRDFFDEVEELRGLFANVIGASGNDIAIVNSSAYGIALAAGSIQLKEDENIVVPADEHATTYHKWRVRASACEASLRVTRVGPDADWTSAIVEAIDQKTRVVCVPNVHWSDGRLFDLHQIGVRAREVGAIYIVDGTQSIGALQLDIGEVAPDYLVCSAYKWLLCPYTLAFLYVAPQHQVQLPFEEHYFNRLGAIDHEGRLEQLDAYDNGARRFDMGERSNFITVPMAITALKQLAEWSVVKVASEIAAITDTIIEGARRRGYSAPPRELRAGHLFGLRRPEGLPPGLAKRLQAAGVFVSLRGDAIRVSPHLYNTEADVGRFLDVLKFAG